LALNRRTAPDLYLEVRGVVRTPHGLKFSPDDGAAIDWVVVMRRFDQALLFDSLAKRGGLDSRVMDDLADHIASFHDAAERRFEHGGAVEMAKIAEIQHRCLEDVADQADLARGRVDELLGKWRDRLAALATQLDRRRAAGKVRHCHGDLHLRNVCLLDGKATLFDCLEFSDALASIDILYDLAFLLMDLEHRGLARLASRVLNRYLDRTEEDDGLAAMPLFLSLRAGIRAHVTASALKAAGGTRAPAEMADEARCYLDLAHEFLRPAPCRLIAIGGVSGSGKSTLAAELAPTLGLRPGARVLRSDVTRKLMLGTAPETPLPAGAYTSEESRRVYDALRRKAAAGLAAGYSVIIDAVSLRADERKSFGEVARTAAVPFSGFWLEAPHATIASRIRARRHDASDATPAILAQQLRQDPGPIDWIRIDASGGLDDCLAAVQRALPTT
jgi:aminoglycoside phosphotransferase family enzyme/predicted kinase